LTRKVNGKTISETFSSAAELQKAQREVEAFHRFRELSRQLLEINERICRARPVEDTVTAQKKNGRSDPTRIGARDSRTAGSDLQRLPQEQTFRLSGHECRRNRLCLEDRKSPAIWCEVFSNTSSILDRMAVVAHARNAKTRRYEYNQVALDIDSEAIDRMMRLVHQLLWRDWMSGPLEMQEADLLRHLRNLSPDLENIIAHWLESQPFRAYIPDLP
jgi:hypothetical protein